MCSLRDELSSFGSEVTELKTFKKKDARALGNVDGIIQDASEMKLLNQYLPNNNNFGSDVRPNSENGALQEDVQAQTLTQNEIQNLVKRRDTTIYNSKVLSFNNLSTVHYKNTKYIKN